MLDISYDSLPIVDEINIEDDISQIVLPVKFTLNIAI